MKRCLLCHRAGGSHFFWFKKEKSPWFSFNLDRNKHHRSGVSHEMNSESGMYNHGFFPIWKRVWASEILHLNRSANERSVLINSINYFPCIWRTFKLMYTFYSTSLRFGLHLSSVQLTSKPLHRLVHDLLPQFWLDPAGWHTDWLFKKIHTPLG